jgi:hypothetical protein
VVSQRVIRCCVCGELHPRSFAAYGLMIVSRSSGSLRYIMVDVSVFDLVTRWSLTKIGLH